MYKKIEDHLPIINNFLLAFIVLINSYLITAPFIPYLTYHWENHTQLQQKLYKIISSPPKSYLVTSKVNRLIVPTMLLNQSILEGSTADQYKVLNKGIWRYATGSTPDKGGNTVLIGHRFTYTIPKGVFYYLNLVRLGDHIAVIWQGKEYVYSVSSVNVVPPTDVSIEAPTKDSRLTLFTCTPIWLPEDRLVIVAELK
jgi:LPXTG-site transpeptidase (sortase) family protein